MSAVVDIQSVPRAAEQDEIRVRRMDFQFADDGREFWYDDNPVLTAFLTGLSVSFPAGERYFIDSVRHFQPQIKDKALVKKIRAFIGQEAHHTREHEALNAYMESKGYPIAKMEKIIADRIAWIQGKSTPEQNLARTAALEHFTAIMAGAFLERPETLEKMDPEMAKLWAWHAIEEIEHRAVAFDVYKAIGGDEKLRRQSMRTVTYFFILMNTVRTWKLLETSGNRYNVKAWLGAINQLWIKPGLLRRIVPQYLSYYRKDFHPSQHDMRERVARAKRRYLGETD